MTLLFMQIHFETNIFLSTKGIWEREKRWLISYILAWGSDRSLCLKILPSRKNEIHLWKMATEVGMYSATHESVTMPVGRDEIIRTAPRTNQIAGSVTALSDKKKERKKNHSPPLRWIIIKQTYPWNKIFDKPASYSDLSELSQTLQAKFSIPPFSYRFSARVFPSKSHLLV